MIVYFTLSLPAHMHIEHVISLHARCAGRLQKLTRTSKNLHALMHVCTWVNRTLIYYGQELNFALTLALQYTASHSLSFNITIVVTV